MDFFCINFYFLKYCIIILFTLIFDIFWSHFKFCILSECLSHFILVPAQDLLNQYIIMIQICLELLLALGPWVSYLTTLIFRDEIIQLIMVMDAVSGTYCYYINTISFSLNNEMKFAVIITPIL